MTRRAATAWLAAIGLMAWAPSSVGAREKTGFTGTWVRNSSQSDDAREKIRAAAQGMFDKATKGGRNVLSEDIPTIHKRLENMIAAYVQFADSLIIDDRGAELHVDDGEGRVRIFYLDGEKHLRETPQGVKLEAVCTRRGNQVTVQQETEGAKIFETYSLSSEGDRMTLIVRLESKRFKEPLVLKNVYYLDYIPH